ncbi:hypothetical protein HF670_14475 [Acidithiobacillus thiooxidans]|jgi:hypothetical protein|uniref:hypothetical protein n=1 Tax=Acidithiobacillus thiooxidans TaxID=930 RepID=UPI001C076B59|nr:hypothetical protein [Acidithiobacillus thiooxidans]MBU2840708.1 hypothetical protein [Acidithiobacillus thiooxidans]
MSGHFPFSGKANRVSVFAFFEAHHWSIEAQEKYFEEWYKWAKDYVMNDADLNAAKGVLFASDHFGTHADHDFHLHGYAIATRMLDLGELIKGSILPKLDHDMLHALEHDHEEWIAAANAVAANHPRAEAPEIGRYRHV